MAEWYCAPRWQTRGAWLKPRSLFLTQSFGVFSGFLRNSHKYGLISLRKTPLEEHPPYRPRSHKQTNGLKNYNLQPTIQLQITLTNRLLSGAKRKKYPRMTRYSGTQIDLFLQAFKEMLNFSDLFIAIFDPLSNFLTFQDFPNFPGRLGMKQKSSINIFND